MPAKNTVSLQDKLLGKQPTTQTIQISLDGEQVELKCRALSDREIRGIRDSFPPKTKEDKDNIGYDSENYPPAFLSKAIVDPELTHEQWHEIWNGDNWSIGELSDLWKNVQQISYKGFDVPFGGNGSARTAN